jgi:alpha-L-arabinofuranosidase
MAQMVNAIAPIVTTPQAAVVQPIYYPFLLHAQGHLEISVDAFVEGPCVEAPAEHHSDWPHRVRDLGPFPLIDAAATVSAQRDRMALTLVNRSERAEPVEITLRRGAFTGPAQIRCLTGTGRAAEVEGVEEADLTDGAATPKNATLALKLPDRSFTLVEAAISGD